MKPTRHRTHEWELSQAMEQRFGTAVSLQVIKKRGNCHIEFSDHNGLYKAMAAKAVWHVWQVRTRCRAVPWNLMADATLKDAWM